MPCWEIRDLLCGHQHQTNEKQAGLRIGTREKLKIRAAWLGRRERGVLGKETEGGHPPFPPPHPPQAKIKIKKFLIRRRVSRSGRC